MKAMKKKDQYEHMTAKEIQEHIEEMFDAEETVKEEVANSVNLVIAALGDKSPLFKLSVLANAAVMIVAVHAPDKDFATDTLHGTTVAMERSLQLMIEDGICKFQQPGGNYEQ